MLLESQLTKFGLSDKESPTYIALLDLGTCTVSEISKKTGINRSTSYVLLESLAKKGLVSTTDRKSSRFYTPVPPERFIYLCEEKLKQSQELLGLARQIVPELKSMHHGVGNKPKIRFLEGEEGLKSLYEDTLTSKETIRAFASIDDMHTVLPGYFPDYYHRRAVKGINIRAILPDSPAARERIERNAEEARDACLVPPARYGFTPEINIYDNKVVFMSLREQFGLIIESAELSDALKKAFDLAWEEAKRLGKNLV